MRPKSCSSGPHQFLQLGWLLPALAVHSLAWGQTPVLDSVFSAGFEASGTVVFVGETSAIFSAAGTSQDFEVSVFDASGAPAPAAEVSWEIESLEGISVSALGPRTLRVTAEKALIGTRPIRARALESAAKAHVVLAELNPGVVTVALSDVVSIERDAVSGDAQITLVSNPITTGLEVGNMVLGGGRASLQERITSVSIGGGFVTLTTSLASLIDVYHQLAFSAVGEGVYVESVDAPFFAQKGQGPCQIDATGDAVAQLSGRRPGIRFRVKPVADFSVSETDEVFVELGYELRGSVAQPPWQIAVSGEGSVGITCQLKLADINTPPVKAGPLPVFANGTISVGYGGTVGANEQTTFAGPTGLIYGTSRRTIVFSNGSWDTRQSDSLVSLPFSDFAIVEGESAAALTAQLEFFGLVDVGLGIGAEPIADLTPPVPDALPVPVDSAIAVFTFAEAKLAAPRFDLTIPLPVSPTEPDYAGPSWAISAVLSEVLKVDLSGGVIEVLAKQLGLPTQLVPDFPLVPDQVFRAIQSPTVALDAACISPCVLAPDETTAITVNAARPVGPPVDLGVITLAAADNGDSVVSDLAVAAISNGAATVTVPQDPEGDIRRIYPRLWADRLSELLPYASPVAPVELFPNRSGLIHIAHDLALAASAASLCGGTTPNVDFDEDRRPVGFGGATASTVAASAASAGGSGLSSANLSTAFADTEGSAVFQISGAAANSTTSNCAEPGPSDQVDSEAGLRLTRDFRVPVPMDYELEFQCSASAATSSARLGIGPQALFTGFCGIDQTQNLSGNGLLNPGSTITLDVVATSSGLDGGTNVSVTLILTPRQ